jgi:N-acetylmuramoyl-L-alanine amidase
MVVYVINAKKAITALKIISVILIVAVVGSLIIGNFPTATSEISASPERVIVIDAGHGGEDPGAVGVNGTYEKDVNLSIAILLGDTLKEKGYTVVQTRTEDKMLYLPEENVKGMRKISDLKNRCKITAEYENCIVISIHMNSYGASKYSGLQVYYTDKNEDSRALANKIQSSVRKELQPENHRQIKNGSSLYLLENANGTAVLIECGFLSNAEECSKLSQKEYQKELCFAISCGIIEYINEIDGVI